ncbi:12511_t:CDS:10, partial [Ambispora leptoticha]
MNQTQSLTIVKQLLKTSLSSITYLRGLFPEENYEDFQVGSLALKHLKRDYSREANSLLDWLETGIFDALTHQYLRAIVFGIFLDPNEPNKLVECYTFKLTYPHGEPLLRIENNEGEVFATIGGGNSDNVSTNQQQHAFTIGEIKKSMQQLLRRLILLTQTLKPLPDNRYIVVKLHYYEDVTPTNYEPPFFRSCGDQERLIFDKKPEKIPVGDVETAYHGLNLTIQTVSDATTLEELDQEASNKEFRLSNAIDSSSIIIEAHIGNAKRQPNTEKWSAELDFDEDEAFMFNTMATSVATPIPVHQLPCLGDIQNTGQEIIRIDEDEEDNNTMVFMEETLHQLSETSGGNDDKDNTREDSSKTPPRVLSIAEKSLLDDETRKSSIFSDDNDEQDSIINAPQKAVTQTYQNRRKSSRIQKQQESEKLQYYDEEEDEKEEKVSGKCQCDCGSSISDDEMIHCSKCDTWGHVVCYGYTSKRDPRMLKNHVCYRCLHSEFECNKKNRVSLKKSEELWNIEKLGDLALLRRMLIILWNEEPPKNYQVLRERLGVKYNNATRRVQKRLKDEGFIKPSFNNNKNNNGRVKTSKEPLFSVVKSPENKCKMEIYFDPLLGIPRSSLQENKSTLPAADEKSNNKISTSESFRDITNSINNNRINATSSTQLQSTLSQVIEEEETSSLMEISPLPSVSQKYGKSSVIEINSPPLGHMEISSKHGREQDVIEIPSSPQDHTFTRANSEGTRSASVNSHNQDNNQRVTRSRRRRERSNSNHDTATTITTVLNNDDESSSGIVARDKKKRKVSINSLPARNDIGGHVKCYDGQNPDPA